MVSFQVACGLSSQHIGWKFVTENKYHVFNYRQVGRYWKGEKKPLDQKAQESAVQSSGFHMAVKGRGMSFTKSKHSLWKLSDHNSGSTQ